VHASRVADRIKNELGVPVEKVHGSYGEYKVLVDGNIVVDGGTKVIIGVFPSSDKTVGAVKAALAEKKNT